MTRKIQEWPPEAFRSMKASGLLIIGDSDIVGPEHAVEMFGLLRGRVADDVARLANSQLGELPGAPHVGPPEPADLHSIIPAFLDPPMPDGK